MEFGFIKSLGRADDEPDSYFFSVYEPKWKPQLLSQIWVCYFSAHYIQADTGAGLTSGVIGLINSW